MMPRSVRSPTWALSISSSPIGLHRLRVLHPQVVGDELATLLLERGRLASLEPEAREVGIVAVLGDRLLGGRLEQGGVALLGGPQERELEGAVDERAAGGVHGRRIVDLLDVDEAERQRARRERLDPAGREAGRHVVRRHETHGTTGVSQSFRMPAPMSGGELADHARRPPPGRRTGRSGRGRSPGNGRSAASRRRARRGATVGSCRRDGRRPPTSGW